MVAPSKQTGSHLDWQGVWNGSHPVQNNPQCKNKVIGHEYDGTEAKLLEVSAPDASLIIHLHIGRVDVS